MDICHILIIDDHAMFRSGLALILERALTGIAIHEAASLNESMRVLEWEPRVVVLDVHLQGLNGLESMAMLRLQWPKAAIVVVSGDATDVVSRTALNQGAVCFVSKAESATRIVEIIRRVICKAVSHTVTTKLDSLSRLTPRQLEVLDLLCQGLPNKTIGRRLDISENTVRGHVQALLVFLDVPSRTKAVFEARRRGLVS